MGIFLLSVATVKGIYIPYNFNSLKKLEVMIWVQHFC